MPRKKKMPEPKKSSTKKPHTIPGFRHVRTLKNISEFELTKNGLRVLYMHLPGSGTITSNIVYLVGSRHEARGETGIAHMFEHMLFKPLHDGTGKKITKSGYKTLDDAGAISNATTWLDRTNYFFTIPIAYFKAALTFEATRMRNLIIDNKEFIPERTNVLSEYEMHAGMPFDVLSTEIMQVAFVSHGYGHETIGHKSDIKNITVEKMRAFYDTYYWPNNAVLTIVGDIPLSDALTVVCETLGSIPHSPEVIPKEAIVEPLQEGERAVEINRPTPINIYACSYKVPNGRSYDWAVLHVIAAYLTDGAQSRLDDVLVDTHKASAVDCALYPTHDDGLFTIHAQITGTSSHDEVEKIILKQVAELTKKPINKKRLGTIKTKILSGELYSRDGTLAISKELTECIALGDWTRFYTFADDITRITPRDIQEAAQKYFQKNNRTVGRFIGEKK
jgi:zinc protease